MLYGDDVALRLVCKERTWTLGPLEWRQFGFLDGLIRTEASRCEAFLTTIEFLDPICDIMDLVTDYEAVATRFLPRIFLHRIHNKDVMATRVACVTRRYEFSMQAAQQAQWLALDPEGSFHGRTARCLAETARVFVDHCESYVHACVVAKDAQSAIDEYEYADSDALEALVREAMSAAPPIDLRNPFLVSRVVASPRCDTESRVRDLILSYRSAMREEIQ